ncbi:helix-turn-helix transcriptional regulator [bacterium]|nr:helix-turn-helix transcriptional regulator [bacterium]
MLRQSRLVKGVTQVELAARTGIPVRRISYYERGMRPASRHDLRLMATSLGVEVKPDPRHRARRLPTLEGWQKVAPICQELGITEAPLEFQQQVPCTPLQGVAWSQLVHQGALVGAASPAALGFESYPIVDVKHDGLGHQPLPCLSWTNQEQRFVLWPQVRLRTRERSYLLDGLLLAAGWRSSGWVGLKLDGEQNDWDNRLHENLQLRLLKIQDNDIYRCGLAQKVEWVLSPGQQLFDSE